MGKQNFTKQQLKRYEELKVETGLSIFTSINQETDPKDAELFSEIINTGTELVTLMTLYREQLLKQQELPLSIYDDEIQSIKIVSEYIEETLKSFIKNS